MPLNSGHRNSNGLELIKTSSCYEKKDFSPESHDLSSLTEFIMAGFGENESRVIMYLNNEVLIGVWKNQEFIFPREEMQDFDLKHLLNIRVFNEEKELSIWKSGKGFNNRLRLDNAGTEQEAVDSYQVLFGTDYKNMGNGFTCMFERRGTEIRIPGIFEVNELKKRAFLKARNYLDYHNKTGQAFYCDCRFIGFYDYNKNLIKFPE